MSDNAQTFKRGFFLTLGVLAVLAIVVLGFAVGVWYATP